MLTRRTMLTLLAAAPLAPAPLAAAADDLYPSNTALYADPDLREGIDYVRRFRRHGVAGDGPDARAAFPRTVIVAPHGGAIEAGTSELCVAIAGYRPGDQSPAGAPAYDYWMFEAVRETGGNAELHVTATHCDDPIALALCGGMRHAVALHGCSTDKAELPSGTAATMVGGRDASLKQAVRDELASAGFASYDAASIPDLRGEEPANIANRTLLGMGVQLEITEPQRRVMFAPGKNTLKLRKDNTTDVFAAYVAAVRSAIANLA